MVLLAYQSTGAEENDATIIEQRLTGHHRVSVRLSCIREHVELLLREAFGEVECRSIRNIGHEKSTGTDHWQVDIFRDQEAQKYKKLGMLAITPLPEDVGDEREEAAEVPQELHALVSQFHEAMLGVAPPGMLDAFVSDSARAIHRLRKTQYAERNNRLGAIAELIGAEHSQQVIRRFSLPLRPIVYNDLPQPFRLRDFSPGPLPSQLVFLERSGQAILEVDMLCEASTFGYIGMDFTTARRKRTRLEKQDVLLQVAERHLQKPILLLNVFMCAAKEFILRRTANLVYRMNMAHNLDFKKLADRPPK